MSTLSNKHFWLGVGAVGALAVWFWLTPVADHGGGTGMDVASRDDEAAQQDEAAEEDGGLAESGVTEGLGEGGDDKAWNPDGEDEPRGVQEFE